LLPGLAIVAVLEHGDCLRALAIGAQRLPVTQRRFDILRVGAEALGSVVNVALVFFGRASLGARAERSCHGGRRGLATAESCG